MLAVSSDGLNPEVSSMISKMSQTKPKKIIGPFISLSIRISSFHLSRFIFFSSSIAESLTSTIPIPYLNLKDFDLVIWGTNFDMIRVHFT